MTAATYSIEQTHCRGWHHMQWRIHILIILSNVQHDPFTEWRGHSLSLDNRLTKIAHRILDECLFQDMIFFIPIVQQIRKKEQNKII